MKKLLLYLSFLTFVFCTVMSSCDQKNDLSSLIISGSSQNINSENKLSNPLEYIGREHNLFMSDFTYYLENSYLNNDWNNIEFLSDQYKSQFSKIMNDAFHKRYSESTSTISFQESIYNQLEIDEWFDEDASTCFDLAETVLVNKATNKDKEFTIKLLNDIYTTTKEATYYGSVYSDLEEVISRHEVLILSENWSSNEDFALGALAVAKYSLLFWENYDFSVFPNSNIYRAPNTRNSIIVGADVAGYVIGGAVGATGGSFAGPAGTVGGFLGGKAIGAWAGSSAAAAGIAIYDAWKGFFKK